jgi:hypothetical protein
VVGRDEHAALQRLGVRQVVLDAEAFPLKVSPFGPAFTLAGLRGSAYLELVRPAGDEDGLWVFRVRPEAGSPGPPPPPSPLGAYWEAESLARDTGRVVAEAGAWGGRLVTAEAPRDAPGFLTHGPHRYLPPGRYRATFRVRGDGAEATVQVAARARTLAERTVALAGPGFQEVSLAFEVEAPTILQYRIRWNGRGRAQADAVLVTFADGPDPPAALEVEALSHELIERADPAASGGRAGLAAPERTARDLVWLGPLRRYPAGRYRLLVRLRVEGSAGALTGPLAWCGVRAASWGPILGGRDLSAAELPADGGYAELAVPFTLAEPTVVELPCRYGGRAAIWFDRLRVEGPLAS